MTKVNQQELIERLKATQPGYSGTLRGDGTVAYNETPQDILRNPDGPEAAEALQSLLVENERLREGLREIEQMDTKEKSVPMLNYAEDSEYFVSRKHVGPIANKARTLLGDS